MQRKVPMRRRKRISCHLPSVCRLGDRLHSTTSSARRTERQSRQSRFHSIVVLARKGSADGISIPSVPAADHDLTTVPPSRLALVAHKDLRRIIRTNPSVAKALWRDTLVDASISREWIFSSGARFAAAQRASNTRDSLTKIPIISKRSGSRFPGVSGMSLLWRNEAERPDQRLIADNCEW